MARARQQSTVTLSMVAALIGLALLIGPVAFAGEGGGQPPSNDHEHQTMAPAGVKTDDTHQTSANPSANSLVGAKVVGAENGVGPVRMARFAFVSGHVTWRGDETSKWSEAAVNLPLREGAQIAVKDGGRVEIQFDDGSVLRLGNGAVVTFQTLYSDAEGEFTEIKLSDGLASMRLKHPQSVYQIDTPLASIKSSGPARFRIGVSTGLEVATSQGKTVVEAPQDKVTLQIGDYAELQDAQSTFKVARLPAKDSWDLWNDERDEITDDANRPAVEYLPSDIAIVAGDIDDYGTWHNDADYGHVWSPRVSDQSWRPYHNGHWTWVAPFGWTWVAAEPWGWAPYHYGTWISRPYGWAWVPGPAQQHWSPAVVHFSVYDGQIAWCPLAPTEVQYPATLPIHNPGGNWLKLFSIGQAGVYYPASQTLWIAVPFNTAAVNHAKFGTNASLTTTDATMTPPVYKGGFNVAQGGVAGSGFNSRSSAAVASSSVPINVTAAGASVATVAEFAGHAGYRTLPASSVVYFAAGKTAAPPPSGISPVEGPVVVSQPSDEASTPTRTFLQEPFPAGYVLKRSVYATPLPSQVQQFLGLTTSGAVNGAAGKTTAVVRPNGSVRTGITTLAPKPSVSGKRAVSSVLSVNPLQHATISGETQSSNNTSTASNAGGTKVVTGSDTSSPSRPEPAQPGPLPVARPEPPHQDPPRQAPPPPADNSGKGRGH